MKSKFLTLSLLASALFAGAGMAPAMAQGTYTPGIDQSQQAISARIQEGLASGRITPSEAQVLYRRDREIQQREAQYKANGVATPQERQQLRADLDGLHNEVERMIANRDTVARPGYAATQPGYQVGPGYQGGPQDSSGYANGIDNREYNISQRIEQGVRSGRISQQEANRLHRRERQIARHEANFKSDGVVTRQERRQLRNELTALRDEVERAMHNRG